VIRLGAGATIARREVLHGRPWSVIPMQVVADGRSPTAGVTPTS
jgi:hypothetical protein